MCIRDRVGTETGAPNAEYKFCPECRSDEALATFIRNFKPVVRCAEQYGVTIAIEPVVKHIVYDARRARTVLDEIGSPAGLQSGYGHSIFPEWRAGHPHPGGQD